MHLPNVDVLPSYVARSAVSVPEVWVNFVWSPQQMNYALQGVNSAWIESVSIVLKVPRFQ
jgi:hypothetical protein